VIAWLVQDIVFCGTAKIGVKIWKQAREMGSFIPFYMLRALPGENSKEWHS